MELVRVVFRSHYHSQKADIDNHDDDKHRNILDSSPAYWTAKQIYAGFIRSGCPAHKIHKANFLMWAEGRIIPDKLIVVVLVSCAHWNVGIITEDGGLCSSALPVAFTMWTRLIRPRRYLTTTVITSSLYCLPALVRVIDGSVINDCTFLSVKFRHQRFSFCHSSIWVVILTTPQQLFGQFSALLPSYFYILLFCLFF